MNSILKINGIDLEFNDKEILFKSSTINKTIPYNKDDEKSFTTALMEIINLIEFKNQNSKKQRI